ncbi:diguanylate cyclase [Nocardioides sp. BP30]|uniref:GGDEF domain-containing protein n=1 Tax=Nocardioides sp. BP30 TaxID=3036374 RepID=UPI00246845A6|nr:diguanylate cyclase [Nocardioides sp. BP30]WGL51072.1 diguanylate cyclase [Nocardioides sp. BP30]
MSHVVQLRNRGVGTPMRAVLALAILWCGYPLVPQGAVRDGVYDAFALACIAVGFWGASRLPSRVRGRWMVVLAGFGCWVLGDAVFSLEQHVFDIDFYPAPSDAAYLAAYVVLACGLLRLMRSAATRSELTPLLDAAIVTAGSGIVVATFFIAPIASDSTLGLPGRIVASAYPAADVLLIGVLVSLWTMAGLHVGAYRLLLLALLAMLAADVVWNVIAMRNPEALTPAWLDQLWLLGYLAAAGAACSRSAARVNRPPRSDHPVSARTRMLALGCGLMLPGLTLFLDALFRHHVPWQLVSVGSVVLSTLVLVRMGLLLKTVEVQAVRLAALARNDALTGAPNRRTWDHELGRAVRRARDGDGGLCIALIDLDHFKRYNDEFGHQAGDRLLRGAVAAWSAVLEPEELLARYGGEEFGLLLPGCDAGEAARRLRDMQKRMPEGQTFSAGVVVARPELDPEALVALADRALYDAKHAGRACVRVADDRFSEEALPAVDIALKPIVDLESGRQVGDRACSSFDEGTAESVLAGAYRDGYGPELESALVRAVLRRPRAGYRAVPLSAEALHSPLVRAELAGDLSGVVLEIASPTEAASLTGLEDVLSDLKARGARIAVSNWGSGYFDGERLARAQADAVRLDLSHLQDLLREDREAVMRASVRWAHERGVKIGIVNVVTPQDWEMAADLRFDFAQGSYFDDPSAHLTTPSTVAE